MSSSNIQSSSQNNDLMDIDFILSGDAPSNKLVADPSFERPSEKQLGKRKRDFDLDENFYNSFSWNEDPEKKIKLDTPEDRKIAINARPSFANLVSSASLILPPEIDTVVITRNKFVVEWSEDSSSPNVSFPPTQVTPTLGADREEQVKNEIHRNVFKIPLYCCNSSTSTKILEKIKEEKRIVVSSQIDDAETSLSSLQLKRAASVSNEAFNEKAAKKQKGASSQEKLLKISNSINESLGYFEYIPAENVPVRDKRTVSVLFKYCYFYSLRNY
jgi:hypothetical protein